MLITKYLDPTNDFAFRRIFGAEKNKDILIHFLNDMLVFKGKNPIIDVTFLKTILDPEIAYKKTSIVDILCRDNKGNQYIVEMQVASSKGFEKRAQYYASKAYISQARQGGKYENLKEIIFVAITNFDMFPKKKGWKSDHVILDKDSYEHDLKDFSFTFIELPKFHKDIDQLTNITEKWCYFFKHAKETSEKDIERLVGQDIIIRKAYEEMNRFNWNETELLTYEQEQKHEWDHQAIMAYRHDQGMEKGIEIGIEKGREERIEIGVEKGREEERIEIGRTLLSEDVDVEHLVKVTKLSREKICKLRD
jgi:predicted transposase/invertase (TIGR01784 family)